MKAAEIDVGDELYWDSSSRWRDRSGYGFWGKAVVVVDALLMSGKVYCDLHREGTWAPRREWVPLAHLRGPYAATKTAVDVAEAARRQQQAAELDAAAAESKVREWLLGRATRCGLVGIWEHDDRFVVDTATLAELLEGYEASVMTKAAS